MTRPFGGPTDLASQVLLVLLAAGLVVDRLMGGRTPRRASDQDQGTFWLIQAAQLTALVGALVAPHVVPGANLPASLWVVGAAMMVAGTALRWWSLRTLGASFNRDVHVQPDQPLVNTGPYRHLRHPSYTAALLLFAGIGFGQANAVSVVVAVVLPTAAYLHRMSVEEAEMRRVLGPRYDEFAATRQRFIPWIY